MHFVYVIYSKEADRFYVGETNNIENRVTWHNEHVFGSKAATAITSDWSIKLLLQVNNRSDARRIEHYYHPGKI